MILILLLFFVLIMAAIMGMAILIVGAAGKARKRAYQIISRKQGEPKEIDKIIRILSTTKTPEDAGLINKLQKIKFDQASGPATHGEKLGE